jgi:GT2 family glycosyltransferase
VAPSIDVVIPAYNRWDLTSSCLRHLAAQTVPHNVIVVDNGSSDETRAALRRDWPDVTVVELDHNHPFTCAVNLGVIAGQSECVVLLNNDVDLRPDCLEQIVAPLDQDPSVGSVAAVLLAPGERVIDSVGVTTDVTLAGFARLQGLGPEHARDPRPLLTGPEGTTAAYRRAAWDQVEGLDESIHAYMEVLDLAWRLRRAGWGTACAAEAVGVHLGSATFGRRSAEQRRLAGFSRGYLLRRYGVMRSRVAPRTLLTEAIVVSGDLLMSRDLAAVRGRLAGWGAARGKRRLPRPPAEAIDTTISLRDSLALRRGVYAPQLSRDSRRRRRGEELW